MDSRVRGLPKSLRCNYGTDLGEAKKPARPEIVPCRAFSKAVFVEYQPFRSVPDFLEIPLCGNDEEVPSAKPIPSFSRTRESRALSVTLHLRGAFISVVDIIHFCTLTMH
jgi:hypothetical protein